MKKLRIGLCGLGTVGSSVVSILKSRKSNFERDGYKFVLKKVCEKKQSKARGLKLKKGVLTTSYSALVDDSEIDVVIELIGGESPAREIINTALARKKSVITANKKIIARSGDVLVRKARNSGNYFGLRGALTGCYIVMDQLVHGGAINSVAGVFNGTCNYILTGMKEYAMPQSRVIKEAQSRGYAEQDPTNDIDGFDTEYKVRIVSMLVFGFKPPWGRMLVEGIREISLDDIRFAGQLGYEIRLLGILKKQKDKIDVRVHPSLVPKGTKFAMLKGVQNCIEIDDVLRGRGGAIYEGAGGSPAASAVIQDLIDTADRAPINWPGSRDEGKKLSLLPRGAIKCKYYLLFRALHRPGVLAGISSALAKNDINIAKVEQKEKESSGLVPIVLITDEAVESKVLKALKKISQLDVIKGSPGLIRITD